MQAQLKRLLAGRFMTKLLATLALAVGFTTAATAATDENGIEPYDWVTFDELTAGDVAADTSAANQGSNTTGMTLPAGTAVVVDGTDMAYQFGSTSTTPNFAPNSSLRPTTYVTRMNLNGQNFGTGKKIWGSNGKAYGGVGLRVTGTTGSYTVRFIKHANGGESALVYEYKVPAEKEHGFHLYTIVISSTGAPTFYVDGKVVFTSTTAEFTQTQNSVFGWGQLANADGNSDVATGLQVSDFRIYTQTLTAAEITNIAGTVKWYAAKWGNIGNGDGKWIMSAIDGGNSYTSCKLNFSKTDNLWGKEIEGNGTVKISEVRLIHRNTPAEPYPTITLTQGDKVAVSTSCAPGNGIRIYKDNSSTFYTKTPLVATFSSDVAFDTTKDIDVTFAATPLTTVKPKASGAYLPQSNAWSPVIEITGDYTPTTVIDYVATVSASAAKWSDKTGLASGMTWKNSVFNNITLTNEQDAATLTIDETIVVDTFKVVGAAGKQLTITGLNNVTAKKLDLSEAVGTVVIGDVDGDALAAKAVAGAPYASDWYLSSVEKIEQPGNIALPKVPAGYSVAIQSIEGRGVRFIVTAPATAKYGSISVNLTGNNSSSVPEDQTQHGAQPIAGTGWNNVAPGTAGTTSNLKQVAADGTVSTGTATFQNHSAKAWGCSATLQILKGYHDDGSASEFTFANIPFLKYRVIVYYGTDSANIGFAPAQIGVTSSATKYYFGPNYTGNGGATLSASTGVKWGKTNERSTLVEGQNYIVSDVLTGGGAYIKSAKVSDGRGTVAAIQIVRVPETYSATVSGTQNFSDITDWTPAKPGDGFTAGDRFVLTASGAAALALDASQMASEIIVKGTAADTLTLTKDANFTVAALNLQGEVPVKTVSFTADTALTGSGSLVYNGAVPGSEKSWFTQDAWTGTVWLKNQTINNFSFGQYANVHSKVKVTGISGYAPKDNSRFDGTLVLADEGDTVALNINNGYGGYKYTVAVLEGDGTFTSSGASTAAHYRFEDVSGFTGTITAANKRHVLIGAGSSDGADNGILVESGAVATIAAGKTWTASGGITVNGTLGGAGTLGSNTTFGNGATLDVRDGVLTANGTVAFGANVKILATAAQAAEGTKVIGKLGTTPGAITGVTPKVYVNGVEQPGAFALSYGTDGVYMFPQADYKLEMSDDASLSTASWTPAKTRLVKGGDTVTITNVGADATFTIDENIMAGRLSVVSAPGKALTIKPNSGVSVNIGAYDFSEAAGGVTFDVTEGLTADAGLLACLRQNDVKVCFKGADANGVTLNYGTAQNNYTFNGHYVFDGGTHTFQNCSESAELLFGANATIENPTFWVKDGTTLNFMSRNPCGWNALANAAGVVRIGNGARVVAGTSAAGTWYWSQKFYLEPGSELEIATAGDNFRPNGGANPAAPQFVMPASDAGAATISGGADNFFTLADNDYSGIGIEVGEGSTLTISAGMKTLTAGKPFAKYGAGTLKLTGNLDAFDPTFTVAAGTLEFASAGSVYKLTRSVTGNGSVVVSAGTVVLMDGATCDGITASGSGAYYYGYTMTINNCGEFALPAGKTAAQIKLYNVAGNEIEAEYNETTGKFEFAWKIDGNACWWDYEFNGTLANSGNDTVPLANELTNPYYNSESNALRVGYATPWRDVSGYPEEFTAVIHGKIVNTQKHLELGFGSTTTAGTGANGAYSVAIACGDPSKEEVVLIVSKGSAVQKTVTMSVPNAYSSDHLYAFVCKTVTDNATQKTKVVVYLDGTEWDSYLFDSVVTLGKGFQIGSVHGSAPSGYSKATTANKNAYLDFLRVYNVVMGADAMTRYANTYPYNSVNGNAARTFAGGTTTWTENGAWNVTPNAGEQYVSNMPPAKAIVSIKADAAATVAFDLDEAATYEQLKIQSGAAITLNKGGTVKPTVSGLTSVDANLTVAYDAIGFGNVMVADGKTLTFDFTTLDLSKEYVSRTIDLTGKPSGVGTITYANLTQAAGRTATFRQNPDSDHWELVITVKGELQTTVQGSVAFGNLVWTMGGETVTPDWTLIKAAKIIAGSDASVDFGAAALEGVVFTVTGDNAITFTGNTSATLDFGATRLANLNGSYAHATDGTVTASGSFKHAAGTLKLANSTITALAFAAGTAIELYGENGITNATVDGNVDWTVKTGTTTFGFDLEGNHRIITGANIVIDAGATLVAQTINANWGYRGLTINGTLRATKFTRPLPGAAVISSETGVLEVGTIGYGNGSQYTFALNEVRLGEGGIVNDNNNGTTFVGFRNTTVKATAGWSTACALEISGPVTFDTNGFDVNLNAGLRPSATNQLTKAGVGTLTIGNDAVVSGLVVNGGTVSLAAGKTLTAASLTVAGGALANAGTITGVARLEGVDFTAAGVGVVAFGDTVDVYGNVKLSKDAAIALNGKTINVKAGARLDVNGKIGRMPDATINVEEGGTLINYKLPPTLLIIR